MERINENKLKPRRTRGTPAYYHRNRVALAFIVTGTAIAVAFSLIPAVRRFNQQFAEKFSKWSEEDIDRRALFNFTAARTSKSIQKTIDEKKHLYSER